MVFTEKQQQKILSTFLQQPIEKQIGMFVDTGECELLAVLLRDNPLQLEDACQMIVGGHAAETGVFIAFTDIFLEFSVTPRSLAQYIYRVLTLTTYHDKITVVGKLQAKVNWTAVLNLSRSYEEYSILLEFVPTSVKTLEFMDDTLSSFCTPLTLPQIYNHFPANYIPRQIVRRHSFAGGEILKKFNLYDIKQILELDLVNANMSDGHFFYAELEYWRKQIFDYLSVESDRLFGVTCIIKKILYSYCLRPNGRHMFINVPAYLQTNTAWLAVSAGIKEHIQYG